VPDLIGDSCAEHAVVNVIMIAREAYRRARRALLAFRRAEGGDPEPSVARLIGFPHIRPHGGKHFGHRSPALQSRQLSTEKWGNGEPMLKKLLEGGGVGDGSELTSGDLAIAGPPERELGWHRQGVSHSDGPA
jgi:hypothetical protein